MLLGTGLSLSGQERTVRFGPLPLKLGSDIEEHSARVITDDKSWKAFLSQTSNAGPPPKVDFTKQMVIAIFAGLKPTGGFSVRVSKVVDHSKTGKPSRAVVHWQLRPPPPDSMVTQALTYPSAVIRLDKRFDVVDFNPVIQRTPAER